MDRIRLKQLVVVAAAYAIVGHLALQLAVPPGYASPVYPPAGIAVAAAYVYGWPAVAGAALGSLLVNVLARLIDGNLAGIEFAVPLGTAVGAALQASFGAALLRRLVGTVPRLETARECLHFALLAGPVACLMSASMATLTFWQAGTVPIEELRFTWWTWWTGDSIGVLIAAPIVLTLIAEPRNLWQPRRRSVALPLAVATLVVGLGIAQVGRWERERIDATFRQQALNLAHDLRQSLGNHLYALRAIHGLFDASEYVTPAEFRRISAHWLHALPSLQALGWSARVPAAERDAFEQKMQTVVPGYRIFDRAADGSRYDPPPEHEVIAITYIEPQAGNEAALGVNALSVGAAAQAIRLAAASDQPRATSGFVLTQESGGQTGVVVYLPVRNASQPAAPIEGVVFASMRMDDAVHAAMTTESSELSVCILDRSDGAPPRTLAGPVDCSPAAADRQPSLALPMQFAGRKWQLQVRAGPAYSASHRQWTAWWFAVTALATTGLLGAFLLVTSGRTQRIRELVDERTTALRREVAERQAKEQELIAAEQRFGAVFETAPVGLAYTDLDGRFVRVNARFCEITGFSSAELAQRRATDIRSADDETVSRNLQQLIEGGCSRFRSREQYVRPDGSLVPVEVTHSLSRDADGRPLYVVKVVEDLRERLAREAAEASNRAKTEFLSKMSHELRTPLNAMLGFAQVMQLDHGTPLAPVQRDRVDHIQRAGWHLLEMINDVLDLSRIETGALRLQVEPLDLQPLLRECESMQHDLLRSRQVTLSVALADDARFAAADATRLRQVVSNLLSNAIKYNRRGGSVVLRSERGTDDTVLLRVTDTGAGLTAEQIGQLFQPFNRLGRERSGIEGTGIGLVIARHLVELMQGRLEVASTPGEGSTFSVVLQAAVPASTQADATAPPAGEAASPARRIVCIEDNAVNVEVIRGMLQLLPSPVALQAYELGHDGLRSVLAQPPDLLLLDLHLPDVSGLEVLRQLRAEPKLANMPIVIVSADAMNDQVHEGLAAGADAYLTKPVGLEQFLRLVEQLFAKQRR
jgi:PAS domain S-box-containing protein